MSYNGYRNWETWAFMLHFGDYLFETLRERQEEEKLDYQQVYDMVESLVDEMSDSVKSLNNQFLNDIVAATLGEIDVKEIADLLALELED